MNSLARWCYRRRGVVLVGWVVGLLGLAGLALGFGMAFTDTVELPDSESATAYRLLDEAGGQAGASEDVVRGTVVWHTEGTDVNAAPVRERITAALDDIATMSGVEQVVSPYAQEGASQLNTEADTAYASVVLDADADTEPVVRAAEDLRTDTVDVEVGGQAFTEQPGGSHGAEAVGLLAALALLLLLFRSVWAALLPILTGLVGVGASLLLVMLGSHVVDLASTSLTMGALIGLGVGIDYALFIVNRHRKALLAGSTVQDATAQAVDTSGRAVVFAGITVIIALIGMFVVELGLLTSMAQAAAVTVLFTVAAAVTLLPALLGLLGLRVLSRKQRRALATDQEPLTPKTDVRRTLAGRWVDLVQRFPLVIGGLALVAIVSIALPVAGMRVGDADASSHPVGSSTRSYHDLMSDAFGDGFDASLLLVARTPDEASAQAFTSLADRLESVQGVSDVAVAPVHPGQEIVQATVVPTTTAQTEQTTDLVQSLREDVIPEAESDSGLEVYVGGSTASSIDLADALMSKLPLYLGLIALLGFLLLAVAFRSVLVPLVGALTNIATIVVGLAAITAIFQYGWGLELLDIGSGAPVMYLVPVLVVGVVFGLSMDYQVFLVSRMHEEWAHTRDNRRSIRIGTAETAQVIAVAATIMLCVFASFGFSGERIVSMIGIGMAIAVLVDAFVVRLTLVPAVMTLIGRANWWYPRWAERITPHVSVEGPAPQEAALLGAEPVPAAAAPSSSIAPRPVDDGPA
ncbi:MMPL family transporter [Nocardiopsis dassonvillei]|uniref:MMPL family transporter n=1 Tax=Nocardiopsis dassonvillei TaxID=2014 RepID=UPI00200D5681|nr:MMPL family transporter [Nocardiopsis dassonvillei]MCK9873473.1 MMPL family transporter [Nocardiopsis dassonvillei]